MFIVKNKNPIIPLTIALIIIGMLYGMLSQLHLFTSGLKDEEKPRDLGHLYFKGELLKPLVDKYSGVKTFEELEPSIKGLMEQLDQATRPELKAYIEINSPWRHVWSAKYRYIGVILPAYPEKIEKIDGPGKLSENGVWLRLTLKENRVIHAFVNKLPEVKEGQATYLDLTFLGTCKWEGKDIELGLAKELYILPNQGYYQRLPSDAAAHDLIIDSYDKNLRDEVQKVATETFHHYLSKVQAKEDQGQDALELKEYYRAVMDAPERYRGKVIEFTGTLIHLEKRKMPGENIFPGMDYYYQGFLLDADRREIVFRALQLPEKTRLKDVITTRGYFIQRFMFPSRLYKKALYVPMVIASKAEGIEEPEFGLSKNERIGLFVVMPIFFILFLIVAFSKPKVRGKKLKVPKQKKQFRKE